MLSTITKQSRLFHIHVLVKLDKLRALGFKWFFKEISKRALMELGWLFLLPLAIIFHGLGFRRVPFLPQHIGHLAIELDTFVKAQQLGLIPPAKYFILSSSRITANRHLLSYWRKYFKVITHPLFCILFGMITRHYFACYREKLHRVEFFGTQGLYHINKLWGQRPPVLTLTENDQAWAKQALMDLGLAPNQWYVCLHVREGGFLPHNEAIQTHRNASIENALPAIQEIICRGGVVVRVGDASMAPLPPMPGLIDYVQSHLKSERMDVVLCAKARFFLGCTSGLVFLSTIFGVPAAQANMIPVAALAIRPGDLSIPKLVWSNSLGRYLTFPELLNSKIGSYYFTHQYMGADLRVVENESEDILGMVKEMLDHLDGQAMETEADKLLQERYMSFFKPGHYSFGSASRLASAFLRKHRALLTVNN